LNDVSKPVFTTLVFDAQTTHQKVFQELRKPTLTEFWGCRILPTHERTTNGRTRKGKEAKHVQKSSRTNQTSLPFAVQRQTQPTNRLKEIRDRSPCGWVDLL